jgi:DNA-binding Lrp family transcriptional regulator
MENFSTELIHCQDRYLLGLKETRELHLAETDERIVTDELDRKILSFLCEDARMGLVDMGKRLGEHPRTIAYRIQRMEKNGLIKAYRAVIDHNKLGYTYYKILLNISDFGKEEVKRIKEFVKSNPATVYLIEGINLGADIDFEVMVKANSELLDLIKELRMEFPKTIGDYNATMFIDTLKIRYLPF